MRKPLKISTIQIIIIAEIKGKQVGKISEMAGKTSSEIGIRETEVLDFGERSKEWRYGSPFKIIRAQIKGKQVGKISELAGKTSSEIGIRKIEVLDFGERSNEWRYVTPFKIITAEIQMSQVLQLKQ